MSKQYRYGRLNNQCIPSTIAITDNSKFNLGMIANIYVDFNQETAENHTRFKKRNIDSKDDESKEDDSKKESSCKSASECSTCGV
jgi:hypothetical protein